MKLRRFDTSRNRRLGGLFALALILVAAGCRRDDSVQVDRNLPPETYITQGPDVSPNPDDPTDIFYRAHLFWRGEDDDGTVAGFRFAIDDTVASDSWVYTTQTDSIFRFPVSNLGSLEHLFLIRAVDNLGKQDETPDTLRFESFTVANPTARFLPELSIVNGVQRLLEPGDTVRIFSDVTLFWTGDDLDGEVVGWESLFNLQIIPTEHAVEERSRSFEDLTSADHALSVSAVDDAGARSASPARFDLHSNLGSVTTIDRQSLVAKLPRDWMVPPDTLEIRPFDASGALVDTIPSLATVTASWTAVDPDTDIERYDWSFGQSSGRTQHPVTSATTLDNPDSPHVGLYGAAGEFYVRATDVFNELERKNDDRVLVVPIGFRPTCTFENEDEGTVPINQFHFFEFSAGDIDSDPALMIFEYQFLDFESSTAEIGPLNPDSLWIPRVFDASDTSDAGDKRLKIRGLDNSGLRFPSVWDTVVFRLGPPESGPEASRAEAESVQPVWVR